MSYLMRKLLANAGLMESAADNKAAGGSGDVGNSDKEGAGSGASDQDKSSANADDNGAGSDKTDQGAKSDTELANNDPGKSASQSVWGDDWREKIAGDDAKMLKRLERYSDPKALSNALLSVQNKISSGELRSRLSKDATPEEKAAWRQENGIPEKPEGYNDLLKLADGLVIGDEDKPIIDSFLQAVHGSDASPAVASAAINWYYDEQERQAEAREQADIEAAGTAEEDLRADWGGEYKTNMNMVNGLLATAPASVQDLVRYGRLADGTPIMGHAETIRWLNSMAREINPVTTIVPNAGANVGAAIDTEIEAIEKDMIAPKGSAAYKNYWDNEKAQSRLRQLYAARDKAKEKA